MNVDREQTLSDVQIRPEADCDRSGIYQLHVASFAGLAEARLVDLLRENGQFIVSMVAVIDERVIGHVGFSPVTVESGNTGFGLAPVAVDSSFRMRGIAAALIRAGLAVCRSAGFDWGGVLGEPLYYRRFGFRPAAEIGLNDEYAGGDAFQVLEFEPGKLPRDAGLVKYSAEFQSLE